MRHLAARLRSAAPAVAALAATFAATACSDHSDGGADEFTWRGDVPAGGWVRIRNLNGSVRIARSAGQAVVLATKRHVGRTRVRVVATPDAQGVTVCALWAENGRCTASEYSAGLRSGNIFERIFGGRSNAAVEFVVAVPAGVRVSAQTVNGTVAVADASAEVEAKTVNGSVTVGVRGGPVRAESVNGSVRARIDALAPGAELSLSTVNGPVTAMLDAPIDADVSLKTVNGKAVTNLPVTMHDSNRTSFHGTMGAGGRAIALSTVNGSVNLFRQ